MEAADLARRVEEVVSCVVEPVAATGCFGDGEHYAANGCAGYGEHYNNCPAYFRTAILALVTRVWNEACARCATEVDVSVGRVAAQTVRERILALLVGAEKETTDAQ
jgi:hypothetical protein